MSVQPLAAFAPSLPTFTPRQPEITWHSVDLKSGRRGIRLHTQQMGTVGRIIGEHTEASVDVRCYDPARETASIGLPTRAGAMPGWEAATQPGVTMLLAVDEDDRPVWGGVTMRATETTDAGNSGEWVACQAVTLEAYLDRRYVTGLSRTNTDQALIAQAVVDLIAADGIGLVVDAPPTGRRRDRTYTDDEDKTVYSVLADLMGVEDGLEFTIDLEWADPDHTVLAKIIRFRERIGRDSDVQLTLPGNATGAQRVRDATAENLANDVLATSSGQGKSRPESDHQTAQALIAGGWPKYEDRFTPSTSITRKSTLNAHAAERLARMKDGLTQIDVTLNHTVAPLPGRDWHLGDSLGLSLTTPWAPAYYDTDGRLRAGLEAQARAVGWTWDFDAGTVTPRLMEVG